MVANVPAPPLVDLTALEPRTEFSPLVPDFLGYTLQSWLALVEEHGPVFRAEVAGKEQVILASHLADKSAWKEPKNWLYGPPTSSGDFFYREMGPTHITQQDGAAHRRSRKLLLPGFGVAAMSRDIEAIHESLTTDLTGWAGREFNLHEELCVSYSRALSRSQLKTELDENTLRALNRFEEQFISGLQLSAEDQRRWHTRPAYLQLKKQAFELFQRIADERLAASTNPDGSRNSKNDSLAALLSPDRPTGQPPLEGHELLNVIYLLLVAGVGNIAVLATCMTWSLAHRPEWHAELRDELAGVSPSEFKSGLKPFPKLFATIAEAERCYLPAPVVPKVTTTDVDILGYRVGAGTHALQMIGLSHFDEARYPNAKQFLPERWLGDSPPRANAYGGGTHLCLGMGVSRVLLPLTAALMSTHINIKPLEAPLSVPVDSSEPCTPNTTRMRVTVNAR